MLLSLPVAGVRLLDCAVLGARVRLHHVDARVVLHARAARFRHQLRMLSEVVGHLPAVLPGAYLRDDRPVFESNQRPATDFDHFVAGSQPASINQSRVLLRLIERFE